MKDLLQLIKAEIERLKTQNETYLDKEYAESTKWYKHGAYDICFQLLNFIGSLPKESGCEVNFTTKNEDLEEYYKKEFLPKEWFAKPGQRTISQFNFFTAQHFAEWQKEQFTERANALEKKIKEVENTRLMFVNPKDLMKGFFEALVWGRSGFVFNENTGEVKVLDQEEIDKLTTIEHLKDDISRMFKDYWKSTEETASKEEQP